MVSVPLTADSVQEAASNALASGQVAASTALAASQDYADKILPDTFCAASSAFFPFRSRL